MMVCGCQIERVLANYRWVSVLIVLIVIDEIPMAYKDIDAVIHAQRDLVEVMHTLRQVVCVKG
jgi:RNA-splicing ligase RtcB